jgi:hypothetical protein
MRFSRTDVLDVFAGTGPEFFSHPKIDFALDTGLVMEYSPPARALSHAVFRFEGGSTYIHYHGATSTTEIDGPHSTVRTLVYYAPPYRASSLLFLAGIGYRF